MKRMLISAACAIFICTTACAREVTVASAFVLHGAPVIAARHVAQLNSAAHQGVAPCTAMYITTTRGDRTSTT
jgi:hypothetical protein